MNSCHSPIVLFVGSVRFFDLSRQGIWIGGRERSTTACVTNIPYKSLLESQLLHFPPLITPLDRQRKMVQGSNPCLVVDQGKVPGSCLPFGPILALAVGATRGVNEWMEDPFLPLSPFCVTLPLEQMNKPKKKCTS